MKKLLVGLLFVLVAALHYAPPAHSLSLKMQPLIYHDSLAKGEKKKGFVDISNPASTKVNLKISVQAFRQIDDKGTLQFFDQPQISAGIIPDLNEVELGPREAVRMYFLLDGAKLPSGDVFAALFASTVPEQDSGVNSSLRVGTIFALENATPGSRDAVITQLDVPFWQLSDNVQGSYRIKNVAKAGEATGFFPTVTIALRPFDQQTKQEGKLVFAGRERENTFRIASNRVGFYKVSVAYGDSRQSRLVFMMTGYWQLVIPATVAVAVLAIVVVWKRHQKTRRSARLTKQG